MIPFYETWWFWLLAFLTCPVWVPLTLFAVYFTVVTVVMIVVSPFILLTTKLRFKR